MATGNKQQQRYVLETAASPTLKYEGIRQVNTNVVPACRCSTMRRPKYRLSPNEVERLVKEDQDRRRKLRLVQVREQSKVNATVIRNDVRREKERLLNNFTAEIKEQLDEEKEEKARKLEQKYENTLRAIGEGHREVLIHGDGQRRAEKLQRQMEDAVAAEERYKQALERQRKEDSEKEHEKTRHILARQAALEIEKQRAADIASLPPPPPDISVEIEKTAKRAIPMTDMKAFATTHYHIPDYQVVRAGSEEQQYDARLMAQDSDLKLTQDLMEKKRSQHERIERARIRGNEAIQKEMMKHEYEDLLKDLSFLQKKDRRIRKKKLAEIPKQVFLPPERLLEEKKERQRQMENMFTEIFMQHSKVEPEQLRSYEVAEHPPAYDVQSSSDPGATAAHDLSFPMSRVNPALRDVTNFPKPVESLELKKPETVLRQLLNRIKEQRDVPTANQNAPSAGLVKENLTSHDEVQAGILAENKAGWERAYEDSPDRLVEIGQRARSRGQGAFATAKGGEPVLANGSDVERTIESLRRRIDLLESQKRDLARKITDQPSCYSNFMAEFQDDQELAADEESCTLEEVDIETCNSSQMERSDDSHFKYLSERTKENHKCVHVLPSVVAGEEIDHIPASASWPAFTTGSLDILGKPHLKSVGEAGHDLGVRIEADLRAQDEQLLSENRVHEMFPFDGGDFGHVGGHPQSLCNSQPITNLDKQHMTSLGYGTMGKVLNVYAGEDRLMDLMQGVNWKVGDSMSQCMENTILNRKVRAYTESAGGRQAGLDAETLKKVREYQEKLLQTHEDRKKHLAVIRSDIEIRRRELATSRPAFNLEIGQMRQSVVGDLVRSNRDSQTTLSEVQRMITDKPDGGIVAGNYPIQPVITNRGALVANLAALQGIVNIPGKSEVKTLTMNSFQDTVSLRKQEVERMSRGDGKNYTVDTVKKSLPFDDADESFNVSNALWKDVLTDADNTQCSQALTEDSKLLSSEEDRGSPILPQVCLEMSGKSNSSGNESLQLNGSALLVQAQQRKLGFEHRQEELQNQLMDIQRQKDAIMQAYYAGQKALQHRQATLMSKLATASALASEDNGEKQQVEVRAKLADIRSQIDADVRARTVYQESETSGTFSSFSCNNESKTSPLQDAASHDETCAKSKEIRDMDRTTSQQSNGTPVDLSSNSYLAEISFQKINTFDDQNLSSAFQAIGPGSASLLPISRAMPSSHQPHTWATILSFSTSSRPQQQPWPVGVQQQTAHEVRLIGQDNRYAGQLQAANYQEQHRINCKQSEPNLSADQSMADKSDSIGSRLDDCHTSPLTSLTSMGLADHQPHELSTIMEVDTPSSSSTKTSVARLVTSANNTGSSHTTIMPSYGSSSNIKVDVFRDLPFTFRESRASSQGQSGAIYNLSSGNSDAISKSSILESGLPGYQKQMRAKRSLDFSEHIFATSMPALVELTPCKAAEVEDLDAARFNEREFEHESTLSHGCNISDDSSFKVSGYNISDDSSLKVSGYNISDDSSLKVSGYSDYLRLQESKGLLEDSVDIPDAADTKSDAFVGSNSGGYSNDGMECDSRVGHSKKTFALMQQPRSFGQAVVEGLQESEILLGDITQEGNSNDISELSLGLSSATTDLEEVSISEASRET